MHLDRPAPGLLPPGCRAYVIGDVHGCDRSLGRLHAQIAADLAEFPIRSAALIHLGDYIDRGPDSAAVLERLASGPPARGLAGVDLLGNHEAMLLQALDGDPGAAADWLANGGDATLSSWRIAGSSSPQDWRSLIPPARQQQLRRLAPSFRLGGYIFVHAGLRPPAPLEQQQADDLLWIREPFLSWTGDFGGVVVHGHTPSAAPVVRPNRIGIDTGAVLGGRLTCLILEGDRLDFLQV